MKKVKALIASVGLLVLAGVAFAAFGNGWGTKTTATPTVQSLRDFHVMTLSVYNAGGADIWVQVNTTTNDFTNAVANGLAVPVASSNTFIFDGSASRTEIQSVFYKAATAATNTIYLGGL